LPAYRGKVGKEEKAREADNSNTLAESLIAIGEAKTPERKMLSQDQIAAAQVVGFAKDQMNRIAFMILNGEWMVKMLDILVEVKKMGFL
jgi:hypothetical protein